MASNNLNEQERDIGPDSGYLDIAETNEYKAESQTRELKQRRLLIAISRRLTSDDLRRITDRVKVPLKCTRSHSFSAIQLLSELEAKGIFSVDNIEPLRAILTSISRSDIVEAILPTAPPQGICKLNHYVVL